MLVIVIVIKTLSLNTFFFPDFNSIFTHRPCFINHTLMGKKIGVPP